MKRKRKGGGTPKDAYLISFGDTMTALLAFFIVLNSLASDQTGVNLYSGTGSFIRATDSFGFPGIFSEGRSELAVSRQESGPIYIVEGQEEAETKGHGPDPEHDQSSVIDREFEDFERLLNELDRIHGVSVGGGPSSEVAFDRTKPLPPAGQEPDEELKMLLRDLVGFLQRRDSEAELIVWTPTPAPTVWQRSAERAHELREQARRYLKLGEEQSRRLLSSSRQWPHAAVERPSLTVVVRKRPGDGP